MVQNGIPADVNGISYFEGSLSELNATRYHFKCGLFMICTAGKCRVITGVEKYDVIPETELIFLTGTLFHIDWMSSDFHARLILFPKDMFMKAMLPIDTPYLNYSYGHPCFHHDTSPRNRKSWEIVKTWFNLAESLFCGSRSQYRELQEFNYLQGLLLWLFSTVPDKIEVSPKLSTLQVLCQKFLQLVRESGVESHEVFYYAIKLCVSPRYLHKATTLCLDGKSPKELIDAQLVAEIKVLLDDPTVSITSIADQLHFADQSYLSRFFKRHTGFSPQDWRNNRPGA